MRYELPATPDRAIWDIWLSMHQLPAMAVADELGVFGALASAPATTAETAQRLGLNRRATDVLLRMLTALGLLVRSRRPPRARGRHAHLSSAREPVLLGPTAPRSRRVAATACRSDRCAARCRRPRRNQRGRAGEESSEPGRSFGRMAARAHRPRTSRGRDAAHALSFVAGVRRRSPERQLAGRLSLTGRRRRVGLLLHRDRPTLPVHSLYRHGAAFGLRRRARLHRGRRRL